MDRDATDSNEKQDLKDPPHKFQATEETEEDPVIPDPIIDLGINNKTPT